MLTSIERRKKNFLLIFSPKLMLRSQVNLIKSSMGGGGGGGGGG